MVVYRGRGITGEQIAFIRQLIGGSAGTEPVEVVA